MPKEITASKTAEAVSYIREQIGDQSYIVFKTDNVIFAVMNEVQKRLCKRTLGKKDTIEFELEPNVYNYKFADIKVPAIEYILQIIEVFLRYADGTESKPLDFKDENQFKTARRDTSITIPTCYTFDEDSISYWKPVAGATTRLIIKCKRLPVPAETISEKIDPILPVKYFDYLKYGAIFMLGLSHPELNLQKELGIYGKLYESYDEDTYILTSMDSAKQPYRDF